MLYDVKQIVSIIDSFLRLLLPPQSLKMNHRHQIMCVWDICIQAGIYQESLNHQNKRRMRYIDNRLNSLTRALVEQFDAENIVSRYSDDILPDE